MATENTKLLGDKTETKTFYFAPKHKSPVVENGGMEMSHRAPPNKNLFSSIFGRNSPANQPLGQKPRKVTIKYLEVY